MPPPEPPRRGAPIGKITELNESTAPHTPVPPASDQATTARPPEDKRPPPRQYAVAHPVPRAPTLIASPAPPSEPPDDTDARDSQEISTDTILAELAKMSAQARASEAARVTAETRAREAELKAEAAQTAAELRAHEAELKTAAAESGVSAQGPSFHLGSAKWWVLVLGALAVGGPFSATQVREWLRPSISAAQLDALRKQVQDIADGITARNTAEAAKDTAEGKRWTIAIAFLCSQGLRARGINCEEAQRYADFQPQPLTGSNKVRGEPQWKATVGWPPVPVPTD